MRVEHFAAVLLIAIPALRVLAQDVKPPAPPGGIAEKETPAPPRKAGDHVLRLAVSADGSRVAAVTAHRALVWEAATAKLLVNFRDAVTPFHAIALSSDGRWVVTTQPVIESGGYEATLWSVARPTASLAIFNASRDTTRDRTIQRALRSVAFDGPAGGLALCRDEIGISVAAASDPDRPDLWLEPPLGEPDAGAARPPRRSMPRSVNSASFAPDGSYVAVSDSEGVTVVAWPDGTPRFSVGHGDAYGFRATVGAGGKVIVAEAQRNVAKPPPKYEQLVVAWDAEGRFLWSRARAELLAVSRAEASPDVLLTTPTGPELADATTGKSRCALPGAGTGTVTAAEFSADGRYVWVARRDDGDITRVEVPQRVR